MTKIIKIIKKDGRLQEYNPEKIIGAANKSAKRAIFRPLSEAEEKELLSFVERHIELAGLEEIPVADIHDYVEGGLDWLNPKIAKSYRDYRNWRREREKSLEAKQEEINTIRYMGDEENSNVDSALTASKRSLILNVYTRDEYVNTWLAEDERQAHKDGYIYVHDTNARLDCINCCLFNVKEVLKGGFEMGNMWYNEPKTLNAAFGVVGDVVLSAASQQYGGFTLPQIDKVLAPYAERSYEKHLSFLLECGVDREVAEEKAWRLTLKEAEQGFQGWEYKFNTVGSSRGDYPFTTLTFGLGTGRFEKMLSIACLNVRKGGQGKASNKKPVLFPKLVFLYDEKLHGPGRELEDVFEAGIECSKRCMYPDWLSMSGEGYIASMYKQYGTPISPMGCRAFLSPWWKKGGMYQYDETDEPVFEGRFNVGAVSLNLPMIYMKAQEEGKDFIEVLDYYLEMIRRIHCRTYDYLGELRASSNPLGFCEGGFLGGHLGLHDKIAPLLPAMTASFGITAFNELQRLYNGKGLDEEYFEEYINESGETEERDIFAVRVLRHINEKVNAFKEEDGHLYAIYGTPAESLCGKQVIQFRKKYGIIKNVSDREYVSNSFHCHVTADITPPKKQDLEYRFWELCNGGKIQYVRYPVNYNTNAIKTLIRRAMAMGLYEGVNLSLAYCEDCGHQELEMDVCPKCGSKNLTKIDRMNGYLSYSRVHGKSRLNDAKMAEIAERKSM